MARQSKRTPEIVEAILEGLREGIPLAVLCRRGPEYPHMSSFKDWCKADETLNIAYEKARDDGFDKIAADALAIVEEEPEFATTDSGVRRDSGYIAWQKLRFDARLKLLAKWDPKRYGDKIANEHTGKVELEQTHKVEPTSVVELAERLRAATREAPAATDKDGEKYV